MEGTGNAILNVKRKKESRKGKGKEKKKKIITGIVNEAPKTTDFGDAPRIHDDRVWAGEAGER